MSGDEPGRSDGNEVSAHQNDRRAKTLRSFSLIIYQVSGSEKRRKSIRQPPKPPPAPRRGQKTCVPGGSTSCASPVLRPPAGAILLFLFWTVHGPFVSGLRAAASRRLASDTRLRAQSLFLLARKTGAPARPAAWGEEEGTEQSAVLAVRRGRSGRSFFRRHGGCNEPAIAGCQSSPPVRASINPTMRTALE